MAPVTRPKRTRKAQVTPPEPPALSKFPQPPIPLNKFHKKAASQNASPLLRLPAELRIKIFRYLMKCDKEIPLWVEEQGRVSNEVRRQDKETWTEHDQRKTEATRKAFMFSAQILAGCQQSYQEGRHILYDENRVVLKFDNLTLTVMNIHISFHQPGRSNEFMLAIESSATEDLMMRGTCKIRGVEKNTNSRPGEAEKRDVAYAYPAITNFDNIRVNLYPSDRERFFLQCRVLQGLLKGKNVALNIKTSSSYWGYTRHVPNSWLDSCQILRCRDINFVSQTGSKVEKIRKLIVSKEAVADHSELMHNAHCIYNQLISRIKGTSNSYEHDLKSEFRLLKLNFMKCNQELTEKHNEEFLKTARHCTEAWKKHKLESIETQKQQAKDDHKQILKMIKG